MHFQIQLAGLLEHPRGALGRIARTLGAADVTMANLESAVTTRGSLDPKELETPERRFWFRASPAAFDVLRGAGIDVVTMANNHGADYGPVGLADSLRAARRSPLGVIGIGRDRRAAFAPYRVVVGETHLAFLAADTSPREGTSSVWSAGPNSPGIADARAARPRVLLTAVRTAARRDDVVVVYVHWGTEGARCPDPRQRHLARLLSRAGADVVVGTHAHVLQGAGWIRHTYVDYGLANFLWYHDGEPDTGILQVHIEDGAVVDDSWAPAEIQPLGRVEPLAGRERRAAIADWRGLRSCTGLAAEPVA
jgi:poly-gamma-glutamate capsule biosynthesis protein CapA/YwtB (metallophosphatase superfamily)